MNYFQMKKVIQKIKIFALLSTVVCLLSQAHAVLLGPDDTDAASLERAKAFPAVCLVEGAKIRGSGVLIHRDESVSWILTAAHLVEDQDIDQTFVMFDDFLRTPCLEAIFPTSGHRVFPSWEIKKDIALLRVPTHPSFPAPLPLFNSQKNFLDYDKTWQIWRGEGHIVGYGLHGHDNKDLALDDKRRHVPTTFLVDVARDDRDEGCGFWSIISCAPLSENIPFSARNASSSPYDYAIFSTLLTRDTDTKRLGFLIPPDLKMTPIYPQTIPERRLPFQGAARPGDSGGPLLVTHKGTHYVLGIGYDWLTEEKPCLQTYFTSVPHFFPWIHEHIPALAPRARSPLPTTRSVAHVCAQVPSYIDPIFLYLLRKKSYTGRPTRPPVGVHALSMSTSHTL